jgi:hypothetical protein
MMKFCAATEAFDFGVLIAPPGVQDFSANWERKPFHLSRADPRDHDCIPTNGDLENIISHADLRYPAASA